MKITGTEHDLKIWPPYFHAVATDLKPWEYRLDDRGFRVGDVLLLREWNPRIQTYTGRAVRRVVTFILHGGFGMPVDYCIMSIAAVPAARVPAVSRRVTAAALALTVLAIAAAWCAR